MCFCRNFEVSEHTLRELNNGTAFPRLLSEIGLLTMRHNWKHEANAESGDSIEHGYRRLSTNSVVLRFLACSRVCHYVWVDEDAKCIHIVGPTELVHCVIHMSNTAATRAMTAEEVCQLRESFGMGHTTHYAEKKCLQLDRILLFLVMGSCFILLVTYWSDKWCRAHDSTRWCASTVGSLVAIYAAIFVWLSLHFFDLDRLRAGRWSG